VKRKTKTQIYLLIAISFLLPLLSASMDYYILIEADFLSAYPQFENTDLDCHLLLKKQEFTALTGLSCTFWVVGDPLGYVSSFYFPVTFPQPKTLVLRC